MRSRKVLLACVTSFVVLTCSGLAFSHHHTWTPPSSGVGGPVQPMDYDVTTDILLGLPNGAPPLSSFLRDPLTADLPADISSYPPDPCNGIAQVWNAVLSNPSIGFWQRRQFEDVVLSVLATNQCPAQVVRDESVSPPVIMSIQPIGAL
jgi:hypothetical protein